MHGPLNVKWNALCQSAETVAVFSVTYYIFSWTINIILFWHTEFLRMAG